MRKKFDVKNYYDNFSDSYDNFYVKIQLQKYQECHELLHEGYMEQYCVDLGGGTGLLSEYLDTKLITGDLSFNMLRFGLDKDRTSQVIVMDMEHLPIRSRCIQTLFSFTVLQNLTDPELGVREVHRVLGFSYSGIITLLKKSASNSTLSKLSSYFANAEWKTLGIEDLALQFNSD